MCPRYRRGHHNVTADALFFLSFFLLHLPTELCAYYSFQETTDRLEALAQGAEWSHFAFHIFFRKSDLDKKKYSPSKFHPKIPVCDRHRSASQQTLWRQVHMFHIGSDAETLQRGRQQAAGTCPALLQRTVNTPSTTQTQLLSQETVESSCISCCFEVKITASIADDCSWRCRFCRHREST